MTSSAAGKRKQTTIQDFFGVGKKAKTVETTATSSLKVKEPSASRTLVTENGKENMGSSPFKEVFKEKLTDEQRLLLSLEITTLEDQWFEKLSKEFTKPYFIQIKKFLAKEAQSSKIFPPPENVYSWSRLTPFNDVKVVIIGQDPYHNHNQAHGLAFSVQKPTPPPPSLKNIYKELSSNYEDFQIDHKFGDLTNWSKQGVLLLNTALTVKAHNANSHSKCGWHEFTKKIVEILINERKSTGKSLVFLLWGNNAIKLIENLLHHTTQENILVLKSVHPSPLSASRGFFGNNHFRMINDWLYDKRHEKMIDWSVVPGSFIEEVQEKNSKLDSK
ncbi:hypothetical protein KAFR_0C05540 [Kazachstania africana CBS 2517]|uniref:Uracil-DNA glycosylase n=1 Tax=Kazachstania africana (strain ATCC 22294 / BCRC 22015 / CBS 2517 / CECT 1963 / NBRC 1671 / NRRL Y-8276) TaxID=1071382 RepID=H2AT45_KAZAF|nr:hypothetical protein KAFR_0C05540 [Kazachstania africana CBS 2517]CCF57545.1 hypothetical protein KAFR_0C05540 [Kazachstania africana CBS 2517]